MKTTDIFEKHEIEIPSHLIEQVEVPVLTGLQAQGDVIIIPIKPGKITGLERVPAEGIAVVRGENGGNTHWLDGGSFAARENGQSLGTLVVNDNEVAYLTHTGEHGCNGIGAGFYELRRQREVGRLVKD